jgi:hypothetical protein
MGFMTPEERVKALEALEERQLRLQKRAVLSAWISVGVAAVVLVALIGFAYWQLGALRREMAALTKQKSVLLTDINALKLQKETAEKEKKAAEGKTAAAVGALSQVPQALRKEAVARQLAASPQSAALLPRIYMQTVSHDDDARAQVVRKALAETGYLVLGIENVPKALPLKRSEVRFYHSVEQAEAEKIAAVMKSAGESNVGVVYLKRFENSTTVRPNHFEVWLVHGGAAQTSQ